MIDRATIAKNLLMTPDELVVGFTASAADFLHPGFNAVLAEAKQMCDYMVVGLQTNPQNDRPHKNKPIQTIFERWASLYANRYVDLVVPFDDEDDLLNLIKIIKPDIRLVGEEYKGLHHTGWNIGKIHYNSRQHDYSSTAVRKKLLTKLTQEINEDEPTNTPDE